MHGIDEGELEIEPYGHYASSLLYYLCRVLVMTFLRNSGYTITC